MLGEFPSMPSGLKLEASKDAATSPGPAPHPSALPPPSYTDAPQCPLLDALSSRLLSHSHTLPPSPALSGTHLAFVIKAHTLSQPVCLHIRHPGPLPSVPVAGSYGSKLCHYLLPPALHGYLFFLTLPDHLETELRIWLS